MIFPILIGLVLFFYLFGEPMWHVFVHNYEYKYNPNEIFGDCTKEEQEELVSEERKEGTATFCWGKDTNCPACDSNPIEEGQGEETQSEERNTTGDGK